MPGLPGVPGVGVPAQTESYGYTDTYYCFLISADISVLHSNCTGSDSLSSVQIFFHIAYIQKYNCTLVIH